MGLSRALFGSSSKALGSSEGPLDRPKKASRFILELSWAWFARLLLPKITLRGFWDRRCRFFISSRNLLGLILSSYTDPPTLKNVGFTAKILTFCRNQRFRSKNGFAIVFGLSRAPFGSSWGALGRSEGPLDRPKRASRFILELSWAWFARLLLPKITLRGFWDRRCRFFISSRNLLGLILSSYTDPPTLKNVGFTAKILTFWRN